MPSSSHEQPIYVVLKLHIVDVNKQIENPLIFHFTINRTIQPLGINQLSECIGRINYS